MAEPITLDDAKRQLRIDGSDDDEFLETAISDARGWIEDYTGLILTRRPIVEVLPSFCAKLRAWPIVSIDSVTYLDGDQVERMVSESDYFAQIARRPAALTSQKWPAVFSGSTVEVTMTAGFATPAAINEFSPNLMRAMRILVAGFYADRETAGLSGAVAASARNLCRNFRRWAV